MMAQAFSFPKIGTQVKGKATLLAVDDYSLLLPVPITEFTIPVADHTLTCSLAAPLRTTPEGDPGLLLTFSTTREVSLQVEPYHLIVNAALAAGYAVLSFDLPYHGERAGKHGQDMPGIVAALAAGDDPFKTFVADGMAAIDACLAKGIGAGGNILAWGESRGAYCAIRLAAADPRVSGVGGIAPVVDWRAVSEYAAIKERPEIAALALANWQASLVDKSIYLAIGNRDHRVDTRLCIQFALGLLETKDSATGSRSRVQIHVVDAEGHSIGDAWRIKGAEFLLPPKEG